MSDYRLAEEVRSRAQELAKAIIAAKAAGLEVRPPLKVIPGSLYYEWDYMSSEWKISRTNEL